MAHGVGSGQGGVCESVSLSMQQEILRTSQQWEIPFLIPWTSYPNHLTWHVLLVHTWMWY